MTLLPGILPGAPFSKCATLNLGLIPSFKQASSRHVILVWVFLFFLFLVAVYKPLFIFRGGVASNA